MPTSNGITDQAAKAGTTNAMGVVKIRVRSSSFAASRDRIPVLAPAKTVAEMQRIVSNDYVNAGLAALFMGIVVSVVLFGLRAALKARRVATPTAVETPYVAVSAVAR